MTINLRDIIENADIAVALDWYKDDNDGYTQIGRLVHDLKYLYTQLSHTEKDPKGLIYQ